MKKLFLIFICLLLILIAVSCKEADTSTAPSASTAADGVDIPSDIEIVNVATDRTIFDNLQQVEDDSTIIVEAITGKNLGQDVHTSYDYGFKKDIPDYGYTNWEVNVTKVYKGDVKAGDNLVLFQEYYIWTFGDGKKQLISSTSLKPAIKNKTYLLFLKYDDHLKGYWPVCDYEGMFAIPSDDIKEKAKTGQIKQSDLDVYGSETLHNLVPIYSEVAEKYFD